MVMVILKEKIRGNVLGGECTHPQQVMMTMVLSNWMKIWVGAKCSSRRKVHPLATGYDDDGDDGGDNGDDTDDDDDDKR